MRTKLHITMTDKAIMVRVPVLVMVFCNSSNVRETVRVCAVVMSASGESPLFVKFTIMLAAMFWAAPWDVFIIVH